MAEKKMVVTIDPSMQYSRQLHHEERHSGWHIFRALYWGIYLFFIGTMLYLYVPVRMSVAKFFGMSLLILAIFYIVYGFVTALHLKLMKRYA
jgi:hypothetical protein